jgi:hypothetical protein
MLFKGYLARFVFATSFVLVAAGVHGGGAHVHGLAELNLVQEGGKLYIELRSPAANIVGFEHAPRSVAEHAAADSAMAALKNAAHLFHFPAAAGCRSAAVEIASSLLDAEAGHEHADHAEHVGSDHSDVAAEYQIECSDPQQLSYLRVSLFEVFPQLQRLKVRAIVGDRQVAAELTPSQARVSF